MVLPINPGDGVFAPWLDSIATNFEFYKFNSLKLVYSSSVSSFTTGSLVMAPEFDPHSARAYAPNQLSELLNKQHSVTGNVWSNFELNIPSNKMPKKHVRAEHSSTHDPEHLRQTDIGQVFVALYNVDSNHPYPYGEVFVDYDVTLTIPNQSKAGMKFHQYRSTGVQGIPIGAERLPLLGNVTEGHEEPMYHGGHASSQVSGTAGIKYHYAPGIGSNATNVVDATRLTFEEPFEGLLTAYLENHAGSMPVSSLIKTPDTDPGFTYTTQPTGQAQSQQISAVTTGGSGADFSYLWKIAAKAGDILDLYWDGSGTFTFSDVLLTAAEFGAVLL